ARSPRGARKRGLHARAPRVPRDVEHADARPRRRRTCTQCASTRAQRATTHTERHTLKGRFFVDPDPTHSERASLDAAGARHLRALRVREGDEVCAIVGPGRERAAVIERLGRDGALLALGTELPPSGRDPVAARTLALALGDLARMDLVVEK